MTKKTSNGCLRPEEKQALQLRKNELIRNAVLCVKNFDLDKEEIDTIIRMLVTLTYHRVSAYLERMNELNDHMYVLRGIYSKHVAKTQTSPSVQQPTPQTQSQQQMTQTENFITDYNDWR